MRPAALFALGATLGLLACPPDSAVTSSDPSEVPLPDLAGVEPDVVHAIEADQRALRAALEDPDAWGELGARYMVHEFQESAAECFRRAEELDPENGVWPYRRGWSLVDEHPEEALTAFRRAQTMLPEYAPLFEAIATTLVRLDRLEEARSAFERATTLDAKSAHAETGLGQLALAAGEHEEARVHLEEALARDPKHAEAHVALAQAYMALGRTEDAQKHAARSRSLPPTTPRKDWLASMNAAPAGFRARTKAALQLENRGKLEEALEQLEIALESNPSYEFARQRMAGVLGKLGRRAEAVALLEEGLALNPRSRELEAALTALRAGGAE